MTKIFLSAFCPSSSQSNAIPCCDQIVLYSWTLLACAILLLLAHLFVFWPCLQCVERWYAWSGDAQGAVRCFLLEHPEFCRYLHISNKQVCGGLTLAVNGSRAYGIYKCHWFWASLLFCRINSFVSYRLMEGWAGRGAHDFIVNELGFLVIFTLHANVSSTYDSRSKSCCPVCLVSEYLY